MDHNLTELQGYFNVGDIKGLSSQRKIHLTKRISGKIFMKVSKTESRSEDNQPESLASIRK